MRHVAVSFLVAFIGLTAMALVVPGIRIRDPRAAAEAVLVFWALNLFLRPVVLALFAPISTALVILVSLILQVGTIFALGPLVPGVEIDTVPAAFLGSWVYAIVNTVLTAVFSISDDDSHFGALVRRLRMQRADAIHTTDPGLVIVQIDGLSHDVLKAQLHAGRAPVMTSWIRGGSHRLVKWEALLPSQTSASQTGILHGNNDGIPAFRWWDKSAGRLLVSNRPEDATEIIRRVSNGQGLLSGGGASINNLASGDASRSYLTMSTLRAPGGGFGGSLAFASYFVSPYNYLHTIVRFVGETLKEIFQARRQDRAGVVPRMHRGFPYPLLRAVTNVALRALGVSLALEEMYRGTPVIYIDFTDYDEIAHHSGPERSDALDALDGVDRAIGTLQKAAEDAARPYRFVVLSDHGQTLGATFRQRYGQTLEAVVQGFIRGPTDMQAATTRVEEYGQINAFVDELRQTGGITGRMTRALTGKRGETAFGPDAVKSSEATSGGRGLRSHRPAAPPEVVVVASGNLGLISFPREPGRLTLSRIDDRYPGLVDALVNHPGIGFLVVTTKDQGSVAIGHNGSHVLDTDAVQGRDPLETYGEYAATGLRRVAAMETAPDILAISVYDAEADEVAAFEELIGSHGGLGGPQTRPFLLHPSDWPLDESPLVGAPSIYRQLRRWMEHELGLQVGPPRQAPAAPTAPAAPEPEPASTPISV